MNRPTSKDMIDGVLAGDRAMLARAITLIESRAAKHKPLAQEVLLARVQETAAAAITLLDYDLDYACSQPNYSCGTTVTVRQ